ncbi:response regulator [Pseudomonas laurentiana]|uniref:Response regulator n=1 Tax=Pseudomonas laurentiana TaxID=2364649 RepID=A0A6I5RR83_9PSED|nr:response regulator [Pseudomonas laurentiana]NES10413.1 response regulator [Pseudomonas laurentiana]GGU75225.1 response regulator [Pseudomonas laurentiana]
MTDHENILSDAEREALSAVMHAPVATVLSVLIVDDQRDAANHVAEQLCAHGFQCQVLDNGNAALERLQTDRTIGLLITGLHMAPVEGLELIRLIRASERAALPVVIIAGEAEVQDAISAMHLGVVDFLLRPIDMETLLVLVRRELGMC